MLEDAHLRIAVARRLGAPVCQPHVCRCGSTVDSLGHHGLVCKLAKGRHGTHAVLNAATKRALNSARVPSTLEPPGLDRGDGKRPDGVTAFPWRNGKPMVWDVTVADTFAQTYIGHTSRVPGSAAEVRENQKLGNEPASPLTREFLESFHGDGLIIDPACLEYGRVLGSGYFGTVYEGLLRSVVGEPAADARRVAIKTIQDLPDFLKEGSVMKYLRHDNVIKLYGICVSSLDGTLTSPGLVMPLMSNGDLNTYVKQHDVVPKDMLRLLVQIAEGMAYLSNHKIIHRDLAARNCLLDDKLNVHIADFGLSRDLYESSFYCNPKSKTHLPYLWTAPECFHSPYSTQSDVWSFGVVVWELFEKGKRPYGGMDCMMLRDLLDNGFRLGRPASCPPEVYAHPYDLMEQCWSQVPASRPTFSCLCVDLRDIQNAQQLNGSAPRYDNVCALPPRNDPGDSDGGNATAGSIFLNAGYFAAAAAQEN
ncbi:tyrosine-protein kinase Mer-like [Paramacrobiotus metropolitanus]|uniref:tyrosine-protein kinase Mer-like n=1 Tax=Paramacrobiotus metropolitanus TaxID=2943436 RepID=UPI002445BC9A|nr:tyrosine-protein kinase Mer-like [Paramacrobiotus metropolitanus]